MRINAKGNATRLICAMLVLVMGASLFAEESISSKAFPPAALANHIKGGEGIDGGDIGCGFLLQHQGRVYAITAKHILRLLKNRRLQFAPAVRSWSMFSKADPAKVVTLGRLLNEDPAERLSSKDSSRNDWLVFETMGGPMPVEPLRLRKTPLTPGETLYVVGWTRHQRAGLQRVYEWQYLKTVDTRLLLKPLIAPATFGGLSGAPVLDSDGRVVGLVSNETTDPADGRKYFSPCSLESLRAFLGRQGGKPRP